jgi:uncharacterized membrane protein
VAESKANPTEPVRERHRDLDRFLTFLDAIVAIALTLLVLPLTEFGAELHDGQSVGDLLHEHHTQVWAFLLSFAVIARLWLIQHQALRPIVLPHRRIVSLLLLWSLAIVVMPFGTELVAEAGSDPVTKLIYFGAAFLAAVTLGGVLMVARRHPEVTDEGMAVGDHLHAWVTATLIAIGLALSLVWPRLSYLPLLLLMLDDQISRLIRRWLPAR